MRECLVKITGDLMMSFPAGITRIFTANPNVPVLSFRLVNISRIDHFLPNQKLLYRSAALSSSLHKPVFYAAVYVLFYCVRVLSVTRPRVTRTPGTSGSTCRLCSSTCRERPSSTPRLRTTTSECLSVFSGSGPGASPVIGRVSAQRHGDPSIPRLSLLPRHGALHPTHRSPGPASSGPHRGRRAVPATRLLSSSLIFPSHIQQWHSGLVAQRNAEDRRLLWKIPDLSPTNHSKGSGTLCASWQCLEAPRGPPPSLAVQFVGSGTSLSGMDVELVGTRYRMSLVKKRFATGDTNILI
ncbi:hypothetical protein XENOCAPTIV_024339 [Xenoophorus captivus]|uniref:MHD domain-containing protein n=1 Tax=Xenoophorus captivus TaxID=1517983 RepID=A0ABV0Q4U1_9TELE